jgi:hypothetical protein
MTSWAFDTVLATFQYNDIAGSLKQLTVTAHSPHWGGQISDDENDDEIDDEFDEDFRRL